jgi:hypothetical protein
MGTATGKAQIRRFVQLFKEATGCVDCKNYYPHYMLDFDHLPGAVDTIKVSRAVSISMSRVIEEIKKCDVVCANCHRIRTYERGQNYRGSELRNGSSTHRK